MSDSIINKIVDVLEEASLIYFEATAPEHENTGASNYLTETLHSNFYECLISICNYFLTGEGLEIIDEKELKKINLLLDELKEISDNEGINQEDVRRALLLLDIKGFKDVSFSYDIITPDAIASLIQIISTYLIDSKEELVLFDPNFGVGNLAYYLAINLNKQISLVGFESHELLARVSTMKANMLEIDTELHFDDCLSFIPSECDLVISDLATYDYNNENYSSYLYDNKVTYFPYLVIEHLLNIKKDVSYIYLIDTDFFDQKGNDLFKKMLFEKGHINALISLPDDFFINNKSTKAILIMDNSKSLETKGVEIYQLPSLKDYEGFKKVLNSIKLHIEKRC